MAQLETIEEILKIADKLKVEVYLVGGFIRDTLIGAGSLDYDLVIDGDSFELARQCQAILGGKLTLFEHFLTAKLSELDSELGVAELDFARARTECYGNPGALPVVTPASFNEDLKRRDFTTNAIAMKLTDCIKWLKSGGALDQLLPCLIDPLGGVSDLNAKIIRILHPQSFFDDPTRIFRAARYAARIKGRLDDRTHRSLVDALKSGVLDTISHVRKLNEIKKIFYEKDRYLILTLLSGWGVLAELGYFEVDKERYVLESLHKLCAFDLSLLVLDNPHYEIALRVFYHFLEPGRREKRFRELGFGQKLFKKFEAEFKSLRSASSEPSITSYLSQII